tara:strand:+ start:1952 stop:2143 length:192 start_codon:yes stop_codon:yes gene_type:complete
MEFNVIITVHTTTTSGKLGTTWHLASHLPTIQIRASCEGQALSTVRQLISHMPEGTTFYMVAI